MIGCHAGLMMSGFSAKSFYKCKRSARLSACSRNATKSDTVSGTHSRQRKTRVDEDFLYYMHMPKRKKSTVDVPEVDKAVHQTVDIPESTDVLLSDNNAVLEDNAVLQTVTVPASTDVMLPDDTAVLEDNAVHQTVDVPDSSDVFLSDNNAVREDNAGCQTVDVPASTDVVLPYDTAVLEDNAVHQTVNVPENSDVVLSDNNAVRGDNAVHQTVNVPDSSEVVPLEVDNVVCQTVAVQESSDVVLPQDNNATVVSKCHVFGCNEDVFIACPTCLVFLCYEHKDSVCAEHASTYVVLDGVMCTDGYVTVVTETGEFQVPVENVSPDCSLGSASFMGNDNNTDYGLNAGAKHKTNTRKKRKSPHLWKRNVQKENHLKGKQYYTYRGAAGSACVSAKCPQLCNCQKCRFHCSDIFSDENRQSICDEFYQLGSYSRQKDFVMNHVVENKPRSQIMSSQRHHKLSRAFYLPFNRDRKRICANFFANHWT